MISRQHRFHGFNALTQVYKNGNTLRGPFHAVKYLPTQRGGYRLAIVVSRKVSKSAVKRNRIRRQLYETVRKNEGSGIASADIVITVFDDKLATLPPPELHDLINSEFIKAGLITNKQHLRTSIAS